MFRVIFSVRILIWRSRFDYESGYYFISLAKIMNPNLNIWDSEDKIQIRIRIFVTTLIEAVKLAINIAVDAKIKKLVSCLTKIES